VSAETKQALDDAIQAHITDECDGRLVNSYLMVVCSEHVLIADSHNYYQEASNGLPFHAALGLAQYLRTAVERTPDDDE